MGKAEEGQEELLKRQLPLPPRLPLPSQLFSLLLVEVQVGQR